MEGRGTSTYLHPNPLICPHPLPVPYPYPHIPSATRMHCFGWSEAQAAPVAQRAAPAVLHLPGEVAEPTVSPAPAEPWIAVQPMDLRWFEVFLPINGQLELVHLTLGILLGLSLYNPPANYLYEILEHVLQINCFFITPFSCLGNWFSDSIEFWFPVSDSIEGLF